MAFEDDNPEWFNSDKLRSFLETGNNYRTCFCDSKTGAKIAGFYSFLIHIFS